MRVSVTGRHPDHTATNCPYSQIKTQHSCFKWLYIDHKGCRIVENTAMKENIISSEPLRHTQLTQMWTEKLTGTRQTSHCQPAGTKYSQVRTAASLLPDILKSFHQRKEDCSFCSPNTPTDLLTQKAPPSRFSIRLHKIREHKSAHLVQNQQSAKTVQEEHTTKWWLMGKQGAGGEEEQKTQQSQRRIRDVCWGTQGFDAPSVYRVPFSVYNFIPFSFIQPHDSFKWASL